MEKQYSSSSRVDPVMKQNRPQNLNESLDADLMQELNYLLAMHRGQQIWPEQAFHSDQKVDPDSSVSKQAQSMQVWQDALMDQAFYESQVRRQSKQLKLYAGQKQSPDGKISSSFKTGDSLKTETPLFVLQKRAFQSLAGDWMPTAQPVFRSGAMEIVYSDIVAIGSACVLLELANNQEKTRLQLEPGRKNEQAVQISLYKGDSLFEKLQLQTRICWELDGFAPGDYRLEFGQHKSFQFSIQE